MSENVIDTIFINACHTISKSNDEDDAIFVSEKLLLENGGFKSNLRMLENYERPFWITKINNRNHEQKKERELLSRLDKYTSTERNLVTNIKRALRNFYLGNTLKEVSSSPYLYGTDIPITSIIKHNYNKQRKTDLAFKYSYGTFDFETYVLDNEFKNDPIVATTVTNSVIQTTVHAYFLRKYGPDAEDLLKSKLDELLGTYIKDLNLTFNLEIVENPGLVAKNAIEKIHELPIDIIGIWNLDFDIPKAAETLVKYGFDPARVFSDPGVPDKYTRFTYNKGQTVRNKDNGTSTPIPFHERWNTATFPAKWVPLCAMAIYAKLRKVSGNESGGYGLDAVLKRNLNLGKLKFDVADKYVRLAWHKFMQEHYPIEYIVYNIFDSLSMLMLENKTNDIQMNFPLLCGVTPFEFSNSNPKKFCHDLEFDLQENTIDEGPSVLGTTSRNMELEIDAGIVDKVGWVQTLAANMMERKGVNFISDIKDLNTTVFIHNSDLDTEGTYPSEQVAFNMSKETTRFEVTDIEGLGWEDRRRFGILYNAPEMNAGRLAPAFFKLPDYNELLDMFNVKNE
jgi:hypothetical protein